MCSLPFPWRHQSHVISENMRPKSIKLSSSDHVPKDHKKEKDESPRESPRGLNKSVPSLRLKEKPQESVSWTEFNRTFHILLAPFG